MKNEIIKAFENDEFGKVRTFIDEKFDTWFCLSDVCKSLDISDVNTVKRRLDHNDTQLIDLHAPCCNGGSKNVNIIGNSMATFINESALYDVILDSRKPNARKFRKWITGDVLPAIRKTGEYKLSKNHPKIPMSFADALQLAADQQREIENLMMKVDELYDDNQKMLPKSKVYDEIMSDEYLTGIRDTAAILGMKQNDFVGKLVEFRFIYKNKSGKYRSYCNYDSYFKLIVRRSPSGFTYLQLMITMRGKDLLAMLFKNKGIIPEEYIPIEPDQQEPDLGVDTTATELISD